MSMAAYWALGDQRKSGEKQTPYLNYGKIHGIVKNVLRQQHGGLSQDLRDVIRSFMWHKDQKSVCALVLDVVKEAQHVTS